ncbi:uncharacterized protein TNCV_4279601 [Trichonephila clavipes]|nr:uncharacterized protein TNCV_4279601 [Trichonephila clavipes]
MKKVVKLLQNGEYHTELTLLKCNKPLAKSSKLQSLNVFLDSDGIIRVEGRLRSISISYDSVYAISGFPPIDITILHDIAFRENLSTSSISYYDCILSPFFIPHPSERNAINIVQFSDKSTEDFPVICYTDGSKIDRRVGFAFVVFRSGVESENFQFRIRDECTVFVAELLCLNFAVKWITKQNSVNSKYLICTDSLSSLDSLKAV